MMMTTRVRLLAIAAALFCSTTASAQLDYRLGGIIQTGLAPAWVEAGDLDGDGLKELLVLNAGTSDITVFKNMGSMNFVPTVTLIPAIGPTMFEIADMNNDGNADVVVSCRTALHVSVFFGAGNGTFPTRGDYPVGFDPTSLVPHDYNDDGFLDVLVVSQGTHNMQIMINDGAGNLGLAGSAWAGAFPSDVVTGDLDNDGDDDIVVAVTGFSSVLVIEKTTTGYIPKNFYPVGFGPLSVALGDFNRDGRLDIVTANVGSDDVTLQINQGALLFGGRRTFTLPAGRAPTRVVATDVDNRNGLDLAVSTINGSSISVLTNDLWGNLSSQTPAYFTGTTPVSIVSADLDGDFAEDLVALNLLQSDMMILENKLSTNRYPGTDEDLKLFSSVNGNPLTTGLGNSIKATQDGDTNSWFLITPAGQFTSGMTFLGVQGYFPGDSPYTDLHQGLYIAPGGVTPAIVPMGHLGSTGQLISVPLPPGTAPLRYIVQGLTLSIFANNGYLATTDAHEFRVEP